MPATRPNLLFIMADQFRHDFLGCAGADFVPTPNIDALAARGVCFTHCTTTSPICAPARISLATGMLPSRLGALSNAAFLPNSAPTYYQRLRDHGYHVGCVGKLDLAKPDHFNGFRGDRPRAFGWGFTHPVECEGKMHAGSSPTPIGPYTSWLHERGLLQTFHDDYERRRKHGFSLASDDSALPADAFEDAYIGRRAAQWIDEWQGDFPWHLFVSFVGPHDPFDPPTEYAERYRAAPMPAAITDTLDGKPRWIAQRVIDATDEGIAVTRRQYAAAIELIDDQVGLIMGALASRGMADDTYVVFSSDHGEMLGDHGLYTKHCAYEAAMRVPLVAAGPGIDGGRVSDALVELHDIGPTLCDLADIPPLENIDARSVEPVLSGRAVAHRADVVTEELNYRALRTATHKLIQSYNDSWELYDLSSDPDELHNIAGENTDVRRELEGRMRARFLEGEALR